MDLNTHLAGDIMQVALSGEFDIYAAGIKDSLLEQCRHAQVELDLTAVSEIDSVGIQLLLLVWREAHRDARLLKLGALSPAVREMLALYGLNGLFGLPSPVEQPA